MLLFVLVVLYALACAVRQQPLRPATVAHWYGALFADLMGVLACLVLGMSYVCAARPPLIRRVRVRVRAVCA